MMRCECCNVLLTPYEGRIKLTLSGDYANACMTCLETMDVELTRPKDEFDEDILPMYKELEAQGDAFLAQFDEEYWDER